MAKEKTKEEKIQIAEEIKKREPVREVSTSLGVAFASIDFDNNKGSVLIDVEIKNESTDKVMYHNKVNKEITEEQLKKIHEFIFNLIK